MKIRESVLAVLVAAVPLLAAANPSSGTPVPKPTVDVRAWPRMTSPTFGCYVETTFGYRDKRFNCALKKYRNTGDACRNTKAYYEGPAFPDRLAASVHPLATKVELDWEQGRLQMVTVTLKGTWNEADVRKAFGDIDVTTKDDVAAFPLDGKAADVDARGWGLAHYLVAQSATLGITEVAFDGMRWTAETSDEGWTTATAAKDVVRVTTR